MHHDPPLNFTGEASAATRSSTDALPQGWTPSDSHDIIFSSNDFGALPLLDFSDSEQLAALPLDSFRACLSNGVQERDPTELSSNASVTSNTPQQQPCDCSKRVFEVMRSLKRGQLSHDTVSVLRQGADLFSTLLTCPVCYDVSKPPRITLQNVILLGRLSLEITTGYQRYLTWLKEYCNSLAERRMEDTVYLMSGGDAGSALGLVIDNDKLYDLVICGIRKDAQRLSNLGGQFALRQHNRHLIGHEACPDSEGRCWKEMNDIDPDPSDVCPQSAAARALTPCYRIVDEVRSKIRILEDAVT